MKPIRKLAWLRAAGLSAFLAASLAAPLSAQTAGAATSNTSAAGAGVANLVKSAIDNAVRTKIGSSVHPLVAKSQDGGRVDQSTPMNRMVLVLGRSKTQEKTLKDFLAARQDKTSASYRRQLTPEQFGAQFGLSDSDVAAVSGWLKQQGFSIDSVGRGKTWIEFSGTAGQVENAFATEIHTLTYKNEKHIANVSAVSLPEALAPAVRGVLSLNNFQQKSNLGKINMAIRGQDGKWNTVPAMQSATGGKLQPDLTFDTGPNGEGVIYALAPGDLSAIYNTAPLIKNGNDGSGVTIAIVGRSDILMADIETYRQIFGLSAKDPNIILNGPDPGDVVNDDIESTLDVEAAGALAPNATIDLVESASTNTSDGVALSALYIVDNVLAPIMSASYGECEADLGTAGNAFYSALWEQAAAEGITPLMAAGDQGNAACDGQDTFGDILAEGPAVNGLASTPYDVAVGGTEFNENGVPGTYWNGVNSANLSSAVGYIPETVWNESCDATKGWCPPYGFSSIAAGGGGQSSCAVQDDSTGQCISGYPKPAWQIGPGVPQDGVRDVPDVSLAAASSHDGYAICFEGSCTTAVVGGQTYITAFASVGGTSAATPAFAGILSLVEQKNGTYLGQVNTTLYQLFAASDPTQCNSSTIVDPTQTSSCVFYDITTGNNATPDETGENAGVGYDLASGIGSVNAANLVAAWPSASRLATTTTATLAQTSFTHGDPVNLSVQVAPTSGSGVPTGDVSLITDKYGAAGAATLANGAVNAPVSTLPGGTYNLTAQYAGDTGFAPSTSAPIALTVKPEDATIMLSSFTQTAQGNDVNAPVATNTATFGAYLALRADILGKSKQGTPTGTVSFYDGGTLLGTVNLNTEGSATQPTGFAPVTPVALPIYLSVGTHKITASYSGDNSFNAVTASAPYSVTITKAPTLLFSTSTSQYYVPVGTSINMTAVLNYLWTGTSGIAPPPPTGTIQFSVFGQPIGDPQPITTSAANMGEVPIPEAVLAYTFNTAGQGTIGAVYQGDGNYMPANTADSNGNQVYFTVYSSTLKTPAISVTASPANPVIGQVVNYNVTVKPDKAGDPMPTGTVSVTGAGVNYYTSLYQSYPLVNGAATFSATAMQAGNAITYASYSGDSHYTSGASPAITVPIGKAAPAVSLTTPSAYVLPNTQTTVTVTVLGDPSGAVVPTLLTGAVQFLDAVNGAAPQPLGAAHALPGSSFVLAAMLPAGTNVITAQYLGDMNWQSVTSNPVTVTVEAPDYQIAGAVSNINLSPGGSAQTTLTITPVLGFDQPVTLSCGSGLPVGVTCSFSPSVITPGSGPVTATLTLTSQGAYTSGTGTAAANRRYLAGGASLGLAALLLVILPRRRGRAGWLAALLAVALAASLAGCGGSSKPAVSALSLTGSAAEVPSGQPLTLTATLAADGDVPTGTIAFLDGSTSLGSPSLGADGTATLTASTLAVGTHTITAKYSGDKHHAAATAGPLYEAVSGTANVTINAAAGTDTHTLPLTVTLQ